MKLSLSYQKISFSGRCSLLRWSLVGLVVAVVIRGSVTLAADGQLEISAIDSETKQPIPVRMELTTDRGRKVRLRGVGQGELGDHFYLSGQATLPLKRGGYRFLLNAGSEYRTQQGHFEIERHADDSKQVEMRRFADMVKEGWWAGDIDTERDGRSLPIVAAAEGVQYVPSTAWRFEAASSTRTKSTKPKSTRTKSVWKVTDKSVLRDAKEGDPYLSGRVVGGYAALVESAGGSLLLISERPLLKAPTELIPLGGKSTNLALLAAAEQAGFHRVALSPTAWELPVWIASGKLDAVAVLTRENQPQKTGSKKPARRKSNSGRPFNRTFYPGRQGEARWGEAIYHHWLNAGIKLTPIAGSGSGANENPLGINRTYVHLEEPFTAKAWWQGLLAGRVVVTNGPLLRPQVDGDPPGQVFRLEEGESVDYQIALNLATRDPMEYLEILQNGEPVGEVRLSEWAAAGGRLPLVTFDQSGWFAVRAVTENSDRYQLAFTAPYYVESPAGPRISRASVEFFLTWLDELENRLDETPSLTEADLAMARTFWSEQLRKANAP